MEWISVKERLPIADKLKFSWLQSDEVLVNMHMGLDEDDYRALAVYDNIDGWNVNGHNGRGWHENVTHWMPIPKISSLP